jgi:hypothetical protein
VRHNGFEVSVTARILLRQHLKGQDEREAAGAARVENGLVFAQADGA